MDDASQPQFADTPNDNVLYLDDASQPLLASTPNDDTLLDNASQPQPLATPSGNSLDDGRRHHSTDESQNEPEGANNYLDDSGFFDQGMIDEQCVMDSSL